MKIREKKKFDIKHIFDDEKTRKRNLLLCILPFFILIIVFGVIIFNSAKSLLNLVTGQTDSKYVIENGNYLLREKATDLQEDLYAQLKDYLDKGVEHTQEQLVESICNNYVADFYTWTNKAGQYDVGGMYYVYTPQRSTIYIQARDEFYNHINDYINQYGSKNLLKVETVSSVASSTSEKYTMDGVSYDMFNVKTNWTYAENTVFSTSKYPTSANFVVINNSGRYEIVEAQ